MNLKTYASTLFGRGILSLVLDVIAGGGLVVTVLNPLENKKEVSSAFVFVYFSVSFLIELSAAIFYFRYYCKQKKLFNLRGLNQRDAQFSCIFLIVRTVWTIIFGVYLIVQIMSHGPAIKHNHQQAAYEQIRVMIAALITVTVISIIAFIVGLIYQPVDWCRGYPERSERPKYRGRKSKFIVVQK